MSKIFKRIDYLKSKQDQVAKNFGMVSMGYVVEVLNDYELETVRLSNKLETALQLLRDILDNTLIGEYEEYHAKIKEILKEQGDD